MRRTGWGGHALGLALLIGVVVLSSLPGLNGLPAGSPAAAPTARVVPSPAPRASDAPASARSALALSSEITASLAGPASARPQDTCSGIPNWVSGSTYFFTDVDVCFSVPGDAAPPNIPLVPQQGNISEYANGFYVNISTNVRVLQANLCLWATGWPSPGVGAQPISGYDPSQWNTGDCRAMVTGSQSFGNPDTASYYVDCYKYFWPGTNLSFMITVTSGLGEIYSWKSLNETESYSSGYTTFPTWVVYVEGPFSSTNFSNDFEVVTTPSVLTQPAYDPNPTQSVEITLKSFNQSGGPPSPIPAAYAEYQVITPGAGGTSTAYTSNFGPANSTVMTLDEPIQPEVGGTKVSFNITAFLYWDGLSHIDEVASRSMNFTFTLGGGWPQPNAPLETNAQLSSTPNVFSPSVTTLPTGTAVNISVHEPVENVTFGSAEVDFKFTDHGASTIGAVPMVAVGQNTSYAILPGLPNGTSVAFSVVVKDRFGDADSSGVYTYTESGAPIPAPPLGEGYFYLEVYDVATDQLVAGANFTVSNVSWFETDQTTALGFGALLTTSQTQPVYLYFGTYYLTVHAFGSTVERPVTLSGTNPLFTITFYVTSSPVSVQTSAPAPLLYTAGGILGIVAAAVMIVPIRAWFKERRAKAEAEQRRVTL